MSNSKFVCFSANRTCHHDDYHLLISKFLDIQNVKDIRRKVKYLFTKKSIFFLDIDSLDLMFFPIIILRSLWGAKGIAISVRTEYLIEGGSLKNFLANYGKSIYFKSKLKKILFYLIKNYSSTLIISIHKNHPEVHKMEKYVNKFIYDLQLWDLQLLDFNEEKPVEIIDESIFKHNNLILVAGRFNEQRSRTELLNYLENKKSKEFKFIIAGEIDIIDYDYLKKKGNCLLINRFISNDELYYLLKKSKFIYCFYTNNRPSGFFGRGIQLNKPIIVRKNSYLDVNFRNYENLISIVNLGELNFKNKNLVKNTQAISCFDDYKGFKKIIMDL